MSYCRFSDGDVYMYASINGGIVCCSCRLAGLTPTIFTKGIPKEKKHLFNMDGKGLPPCDKCGGAGCEGCMMHEDQTFWTRSDALAHLKEHTESGDAVPEYAFSTLREELQREGEKGGIRKPRKPRSPILDLRTGKRVPVKKFLKEVGK